MIENVNNLKFQYLVELSKQGDRCLKYHADVSEFLLKNDVRFGDSPIPFLLMPHFLSQRQLETIHAVIGHLSNVLEKFIQTYIEDPSYKDKLRVSDTEDALFRIDPGYSRALNVARLDAFLSSYHVQFLEFNCDSPAGIGFADKLYTGLSSIMDLPDVHYEFEEGYEPMLPHLESALLTPYREFRANGREADFPETPTIAIMDWIGVVTSAEFRIIRDFLESKGYRTLIGDPRNLTLDANGFPHLDGERIHLIYRRALVREIIQKEAEVGTFLEVARNQRACIVNSFRGVLAGNKKVLGLILDPQWQEERLTVEEREVVNHTVPWTRTLRDDKATYGGWVIHLRDFVSDNRERLVIKPAKGHGGKGVYLGNETDQETWDRVLSEALADPDEGAVVQEFLPIPEEMFPVIENGRLAVKLKKFNINPFALGGAFGGVITRISDESVINVTANGGLLPCCVGSIKKHLFEGAPRR